MSDPADGPVVMGQGDVRQFATPQKDPNTKLPEVGVSGVPHGYVYKGELDRFLEAWMGDWLENNFEEWMEENFSKIRPAMNRVFEQARFEAVQECADDMWKALNPSGREPTEKAVMGSSHSTYVREFDIDRNRHVWVHRYNDE